ncbi:DUF4131 domain-containing protein, partial [Georgenia ruanii]|nr:DUF4131 domain-containing protein [Georgenia ruanii]
VTGPPAAADATGRRHDPAGPRDRPPTETAGPPPAPVDARLVPAALALWAATGIGVAADAALLGAAAALAGAGATAAALRLPREARARARGRHHGAPTARPAAAVLLVLTTLCAGLASTAVQVHTRSTGLLAELGDGASAVLVGHVATEPRPVAQRQWESVPRQRLELRLTEVAGRGQAGPSRARVVLVGPPEWAEVALGEQVRVRATVRATPPGDAAAALATTRAAPTILAGPGGHLAVVNHLRQDLRALTADLPPHARGLVPGIAVGDDRALPADLAAAMRATSLTHLTAVSGAHVAIVLGVVLAALAWLPRRWRAGGAVVVLVALVTLVRPEASVLRAAVMGAVVVAALVLGRPARALPGLCTAVVVLLLGDPWLARAYGFVLSVLATAGLVLLARPWTRWLARWLPRWLAAALALPAAAQAACAPVVVLLQPAVATYAVPANLLAAPAVPPATVLGVAATLLAPLWPGGAHALVHVAAGCTWWIATVARALAAAPAAQLPWLPGPAGLVALAVLTAAAVALLARAGPRAPRWVAAPALLALVALLLPGPRHLASGLLPGRGPPPGWLAVQCDVGQGGAFLLRSGPGAAVMVDVGPAGGAAVTCLRAAGVRRLDLLVLTHAHADHVGALAEVLDTVDVAGVLLGPGPEPAATVAAVLGQLDGVPVARPVADGAGTQGVAGDVTWAVLWPPAGAVPALSGPDDVNDLSLALDLRAPGLHVLAPGDLELAGQAGLLRALRHGGAGPGAAPVDVVVMAHHGSARQDRTLAAMLDPRLAVVSVGAGNDYGHPAPAALELYGGLGAAVLRTDLCGTIAVVPAGDGLGAVARCPPR